MARPNQQMSRSDPAANAAAVDLGAADAVVDARALYIGGSGDVKVDLAGSGTGITFKAVPVGILPVRVTKVYKVGTGATDILALW